MRLLEIGATLPVNSTFAGAMAALFVFAAAASAQFSELFDGAPSTPTPWNSPDWDIAVHSRDIDTWELLETIDAAHGADCGAPPATHSNSSYAGSVYQCRDHMMTALNASGYGVIYLAPNELIDFSDGSATLQFDMSTLRTSGRDWIDIWITPYEDNLQLPLDDWLPDLTGDPRNAIHVRMDLGTNRFKAFVVRDFVKTELPGTSDSHLDYDSFLTPSPMRRDTFELSLDSTHLTFGMPDHDFNWVDTTFAELGWTAGVVQLGHHSYNPTKCDDGTECGGAPNTWHWDNIEISTSVPFSIVPATQRYADPSVSTAVEFGAPAPPDAHLRFAGIGNDLEVSFDGGTSWQAAELQSQREDLIKEEHFKSYWMPVPAGITTVNFRGSGWFAGDWRVRDLSFWSLAAATLEGDFNGDSVVDLSDYTIWREHLGSDTTLPGDPTPGAVTVHDYLVWRLNFEQLTANPTLQSVVPEPATSRLAGLALLLLVVALGNANAIGELPFGWQAHN